MVPSRTSIMRFFHSQLLKYILMEEAMAWFSTLGGGFSSLGDYCYNAADIAGKISVIQLKLATEMDSPIMQSKAKLWFAQSLMQMHMLRESARILRSVYFKWKPLMTSDMPSDKRVDLMAVGLWERLRYFWCHHRSKRNASSNTPIPLSHRTNKYPFLDLSVILNRLP
ncbi:unnamed protein product [Dicrocoelium dendriticum]|nr:unnamed protein product [Dicrocoelium dendriticum]